MKYILETIFELTQTPFINKIPLYSNLINQLEGNPNTTQQQVADIAYDGWVSGVLSRSCMRGRTPVDM
jgi:hypothetical protein